MHFLSSSPCSAQFFPKRFRFLEFRKSNCLFALLLGFNQNIYAEPASLTIKVHAKNVEARGNKYKVTQYGDEQCAKRGRTDRLLEKRKVSGEYVFKPLTVETNEEFIFQIRFEQKRLRQIKSCSSIAKVRFQAGHNYQAIYQVSGEVLGCNMKIYDMTAIPSEIVAENNQADSVLPGAVEIEYESPKLTCLKIGKNGFKNNVPVHKALDLEP